MDKGSNCRARRPCPPHPRARSNTVAVISSLGMSTAPSGSSRSASDRGAPPRTPDRPRAYPRLRSMISGGAGFESTRSLAKWLLVSSAIGVVAGVAAIVFDAAIRFVTEFLLGSVVGYMPPAPAGEGLTVVMPMAHPWRLPLVTTPRRHPLRSHRVQARPRGRGSRDRCRDRGHPPPRGPRPRAYSADQAGRFGDHHRLGRIGRPRGTHRADLGRVRLPARGLARSRSRRPADRGRRGDRVRHRRDLPRPARRRAAGE